MKYLFLLLIITSTLLFCNCSSKIPGQIIGIKIYDYKGDFEGLTDKWKEMGINTAFVSKSLAANDTFRQELRKRDISIYIIFPVFQNPEILARDSSLYAITAKGLKAKDDWVHFVCPSRDSYRRAKIAEMEEIIRTLNPDGISIDFIRQFVFWEMIYPGRDPSTIDRACCCDSCLARFTEMGGIKIPDSCNTTTKKAAWLDANCSELWNDFRCGLITSMVSELATRARQIKPDVKVNFHAVPWRENDFGGARIRVAAQDLKNISTFVDYVSPMCYSQMLKRDAGWISDVVTDMNRMAPGKILSSIQVYPEYIDSSFSAEDFSQCLTEALKKPSCGVVFFSWPLFEMDPARMEVVTRIISGKSGI